MQKPKQPETAAARKEQAGKSDTKTDKSPSSPSANVNEQEPSPDLSWCWDVLRAMSPEELKKHCKERPWLASMVYVLITLCITLLLEISLFWSTYLLSLLSSAQLDLTFLAPSLLFSVPSTPVSARMTKKKARTIWELKAQLAARIKSPARTTRWQDGAEMEDPSKMLFFDYVIPAENCHLITCLLFIDGFVMSKLKRSGPD